jgi:glutathione S-transferase
MYQVHISYSVSLLFLVGQNLSVLRQVKQAEIIGSGEVVDGKGLAKVNIEKGLTQLEALVSSISKDNTFAGGTEFPSLADICVVPQLYNARRFEIDLTPYPSLTAVEILCNGLESFQIAKPEVQPDAPK